MRDSITSFRVFFELVSTAMGSHHLEYGFPSTHSTNSVSIALFILSHIRAAFLDGSISSSTWIASCFILALYTFSIVGGRLYTAMHSFTDCACGVLLGASVWASYVLSRSTLHGWITQSGWIGKCSMQNTGVKLFYNARLNKYNSTRRDDCGCTSNGQPASTTSR